MWTRVLDKFVAVWVGGWVVVGWVCGWHVLQQCCPIRQQESVEKWKGFSYLGEKNPLANR